jgi:putative acyl-CoA dehydrogenase
LVEALLVKQGPDALADGVCAELLAVEGVGAFGLLPHGVDARAVVERAGAE